MDYSYSDSDVSLSPSQILEKLEMLRQLQLKQRGKLLKQRLDYQNTPENSSNNTELVSHFSNSTSYNTFKSLLLTSSDKSEAGVKNSDITPRSIPYTIQGKNLQNVMDGISILNLSHESNISSSPISNRNVTRQSPQRALEEDHNGAEIIQKKQLSLDEMPILSPKKNFEQLVIETLKNDPPEGIAKPKAVYKKKRTFLRKGEGMSRFGISKNNLIIQNTKSLPWRKKSENTKKTEYSSIPVKSKEKLQTPQVVLETKKVAFKPEFHEVDKKDHNKPEPIIENPQLFNEVSKSSNLISSASCNQNDIQSNVDKFKANQNLKHMHPIFNNKGKTWAAVLTKEQDDFLRQLKQSDYYKNFPSPSKSINSDISSCDSLSKVTHHKEIAEQNLFDLIESKVSRDSFHINNSFFNKFLRQKEYSGESTPLVMQKCIAANPNLMHIGPELHHKNRKEILCSEDETCISECTDCSECCSVSTCCSCQTVSQVIEENNRKFVNKDIKEQKINECQNDTANGADTETATANIVEMNEKLIATSDLLKERLRELEDEIETFRKENANINKMREEIDTERQKFYEEKSAFEQKFNEEKILSEYYLAEEKEKLIKQKQTYERYVREIRGRLNKKEKDEVLNLKKEISDLKNEIKAKDAKSTSTIARLRNQLKIMEKDKQNLENEVEKLKKENKRIQHSNDVTRRLTNIKYLEQINKKLSDVASRDTRSKVDSNPNIKYKAFEIERQSRLKKTTGIRTRAKSVPNLNVTSKYAKYFSQKDSLSDKEKNYLVQSHTYVSDNDTDNESIKNSECPTNIDEIFSEDENNYLEKIYNERFKSSSPSSKRSSGNMSDSSNLKNTHEDTNGFFIQKSNSVSSIKKSLSPNHITNSCLNISKSSPIVEDANRNYSSHSNSIKDQRSQTYRRSKSPISILSNYSSSSQKPMTVIHNDDRMLPSPEPTSSRSIEKTSLTPIEIKKPNGSRELKYPNGNVKVISADGKYSKFIYYNGDIKENFYDEGRVKYFYAESKTYHTTHPDGLEILEFPDGQVEKRYKDGSSEIRLPNGMVRYFDPKNDVVREDWRYPDGTSLTVSANGEQRIQFPNGQIEVHAADHKRREFPDGTVKLVYNDGTSETRYASGRIRIKDKHGNLIMDSSSRHTS
ncbi:unnamed protein product [Leptosia nina]|uniref:Centromere protein J n=1 Tax=Leptosia nina TaxID=320188 RepID=A0AAV1J0B2_9NEOP